MKPNLCLPIVYGRTRHVDQWWRVLPHDVDAAWAQSTIQMTTAGGIGLDDGPRFVLAQNAHFRLVGGACLARYLSPTMNSDARGRSLYCFVGWVVDRREGPDDVPALPELVTGFAQWAAGAYDTWMAKDWSLHESEVAEARDPEPEPSPWRSPQPARARRGTQFFHTEVVAWPRQQAEAAWDAIRLSNEARVITVGWKHLDEATPTPGAWFVVDDVDEVTVLDAGTQTNPAHKPGSLAMTLDDPAEPAAEDPAGVRSGSHQAQGPTAKKTSDPSANPWQLAGQIPPSPEELDRLTRPSGAEEDNGGGGLRAGLAKLRQGLMAWREQAQDNEPGPEDEAEDESQSHGRLGVQDELDDAAVADPDAPPDADVGHDANPGRSSLKRPTRLSRGSRHWHDK